MQGFFTFQNMSLSPLTACPVSECHYYTIFIFLFKRFSSKTNYLTQQSKNLWSGQRRGINIQVNTQGPLKDICVLLSKKPLNYMQRFPVPLSSLQGDLSSSLHFSFPLLNALKMQDVFMKIKLCEKRQLYLCIRNIKIPLQQGVLHMSLTNDLLHLTGEANFEKPLTLWLKEPVSNTSEEKNMGVTMAINSELLENFGLPSIQERIPETFLCTLSYTWKTFFVTKMWFYWHTSRTLSEQKVRSSLKIMFNLIRMLLTLSIGRQRIFRQQAMDSWKRLSTRNIELLLQEPRNTSYFFLERK